MGDIQRVIQFVAAIKQKQKLAKSKSDILGEAESSGRGWSTSVDDSDDHFWIVS